jgi:plastocyanin
MFQVKGWSVSAAVAGLLLLASCGGGGGSSPTEPAMPKVVQVQIMDFAFNPKDVQINPGDTVQWVLAPTSMTDHTATSEDGTFDSGFVFNKAGATFQHTFSVANVTTNYHCQTHWISKGMQGSITVGTAAPPPKPGY